MTSHAGLPEDPDLESAEGLRVKAVHRPFSPEWESRQSSSPILCGGPMKEDLITIPAAQEMFRGRMKLGIISYVWRLWSAPLTLRLYAAPNAPSPLNCLNCHAEAFASWPQFGPSGGCSWFAKWKIVRQASEVPRFKFPGSNAAEACCCQSPTAERTCGP